jgi:hypothetical protein
MFIKNWCGFRIEEMDKFLVKKWQFPQAYEWFDDIEKLNFDIDVRNLKFYLKTSLQKVNRVVEYKQWKWLKDYYNDLNTELRKKAKNGC